MRAKITFLKAPKRDAATDTGEIEATVRNIIAAVRDRGDAALREYTKAFDQADVADFEVSDQERAAAVQNLDPQTRQRHRIRHRTRSRLRRRRSSAPSFRSRSKPCQASTSGTG